MIERLVFISTMFFFMMIGINAFLMVGNGLLMPDGSGINIFGDATTNTLDSNTLFNQANNIQFNSGANDTSTSTQAPGSASSIQSMTYNGNPSGTLGLDWIKNAVFGANLVGLRMAALLPGVLSLFVLIPVGIASALQAFFFMYWGMAGVRAFFGRFL
jgi:hypothetical protein